MSSPPALTQIPPAEQQAPYWKLSGDGSASCPYTEGLVLFCNEQNN